MMFDQQADGTAVPKLTYDNFELWKVSLQCALRAKGCDSVLEDWSCPERPTSAGADRTQYLLWVKADGIAASLIVQTVWDLHPDIIQFKEAKRMYQEVVRVHSRAKDGDKMALLNRLLRTRWEKEWKFPVYYSKLRAIGERLRRAGYQDTDELIMTQILACLPEKYKSFGDMWNMSVWKDPTLHRLEKLHEFLLRHEESQPDQIEERTETSSRNEALKASGKSQSKGKTNIGPCHNCKKMGHLKKDCWFLPENKDKRPKGAKGKEHKASDKNKGGENTHSFSGVTGCQCPANRAGSEHGWDYPADEHSGRMQAREQEINTFFAYLGPDSRKQINAYQVSASNERTSQVKNASDERRKAKVWIMDTGCTEHLCHDKDAFLDTEPILKHPISTASKEVIYAVAKGTVKLLLRVNGNLQYLLLKDVLYVPQLSTQNNLFSVSQTLKKQGGKCVFSENGDATLINRHGETIVTAHQRDNLFVMDVVQVCYPSSAANLAVPLQLWHRRLGHVSNRKIQLMAENHMVEGIEVTGPSTECTACPLGKMARLPSRARSEKAETPGFRLYADLCGPFPTESLGRARYYLLVKDEASSYLWFRSLREKSDAAIKMNEVLIEAHSDNRHVISRIRTDNGTEFINKNFETLATRYKFVHEKTVAYCPQMNGSIERENRTVKEMMRVWLVEGDLPLFLWAELASTATYVLNRVVRTGEEKTPFELWYGKRPNIKHLRAIGSKVMIHVPREQRNSLSPTAQPGKLVGYGSSTCMYRVYIPTSRSVRTVKDLKIFEDPAGSSGVSPTDTEQAAPDGDITSDEESNSATN